MPLRRTIRLLFALGLALPVQAFAGQPFPQGTAAQVQQYLIPEPVQGPDTAATHKENTRLLSSALAVLLGPFGAHRLYLGTTPKVAVVYGITFGGFGVLALLDLGHLLFTKDLDPYRNNGQVFMWAKPGTPVTPP